MFGQREIIDDTLSLAHLTVAMSAFFAGLWVTHTSSKSGFGARIAQGLGAGATAGGLLSLLALAIHLFKLHKVFIALRKDMLDVLTFDQHIGAGVAILVRGGALCGLLGVALFAVGAYTTALLTSNADIAIANLSFWQALPIAVVLSVLVGVLFGIPVLKVRGDYLAVATLGLGEIVRVLVLSDFAAPVLGGAQGVLSIPRPSIGGFEFSDPIDLFYIRLRTCARVVFHDGSKRFEESEARIFSTSTCERTGAVKDLMWRANPIPVVTFDGMAVLNVASPTKATTE